jgi:hypothetical protein
VPRADAFRPLDEHLEQGDILANVPFVKWRDGRPVEGGGSRGIITSNGCSCEDYERALEMGQTQKAAKLMLHVAPVRAIEDVPEQRRAEIESGQHLDRFYVYGDGTVVGDQLLDFTREQPIPASVLATCPKIARIDDWQWRRLLIHLAVSRFHQRPEELFREDMLASDGDADED